MILKYEIHYKFYCVVYSIMIYLLYTNTRLGRLCLRVTFKLLLLNSDRTTIMGGFFLPSTNNVFNFSIGPGLFYNEVLLDNVI